MDLLLAVVRLGVGRGFCARAVVGFGCCVVVLDLGCVVDACAGAGADAGATPDLDAAAAFVFFLFCAGAFKVLLFPSTDGALDCRDGLFGIAAAGGARLPFERAVASVDPCAFAVLARSALRRAGFFLAFFGAGAAMGVGEAVLEGTGPFVRFDAISLRRRMSSCG